MAVEVNQSLVPQLMEIPRRRIWVTYEKPSRADDAELTDDNVIIRYRKLTVLNASRRARR